MTCLVQWTIKEVEILTEPSLLKHIQMDIKLIAICQLPEIQTDGQTNKQAQSHAIDKNTNRII